MPYYTISVIAKKQKNQHKANVILQSILTLLYDKKFHSKEEIDSIRGQPSDCLYYKGYAFGANSETDLKNILAPIIQQFSKDFDFFVSPVNTDAYEE